MQTDWSGAVEEIVRYLNERTGSAFRPAAASTRHPIIARLNEGYVAADFKAVVDAKCRQWLGDKTMDRYLRPQTLFGNKFEAYLQEARRAQKASAGQGAAPTNGFRNAKELLE